MRLVRLSLLSLPFTPTINVAVGASFSLFGGISEPNPLRLFTLLTLSPPFYYHRHDPIIESFNLIPSANANKIVSASVSVNFALTPSTPRIKNGTVSAAIILNQAVTGLKLNPANIQLCLNADVAVQINAVRSLTESLAIQPIAIAFISNRVTTPDFNLVRRRMSMRNIVAVDVQESLEISPKISVPIVQVEESFELQTTVFAGVDRCQL